MRYHRIQCMLYEAFAHPERAYVLVAASMRDLCALTCGGKPHLPRNIHLVYVMEGAGILTGLTIAGWYATDDASDSQGATAFWAELRSRARIPQ